LLDVGVGDLKSLSEPALRRRLKAVMPEQKELTARWQRIQDRCKPVLSPAALKVATALGASLLLSGFFQFFTGLYESNPGLSIANAVLNTALAVAIATMVLLRRPWDRPP
jgi:hypothetical protein